MALKPTYVPVDEGIDFFMNSTATRGGIVSIAHVTSQGSGVAMDQSDALVSYQANPSGVRPLGVLMNDVVNLDLTRQHANFHKNEVQLGGKVTVLLKGTVTTNYIYPGHSPSAGALAYVAHSGYIATSDVTTDHVNASSTRVIGRFLSKKDEDGYAKVAVSLP